MKHRPNKGSASVASGQVTQSPAIVESQAPAVTTGIDKEVDPVDLKDFVTHKRHHRRHVIVIMTRSPWNDEAPQTATLRALLEESPYAVEGLVTGWHYQPAVVAGKVAQVINPTKEVSFKLIELHGRSIETFVGEWMKRFIQTGHSTEILFVEPDEPGTKVVAVWRGLVYPVTSGNVTHGRQLTVAQSAYDDLTVKLHGQFTFNEAADLDRAQKLIDACTTTPAT